MTTVTIADQSAHYYQFNPYIDFCFWILELDGLPVPPFIQHPSRNGELQAKGLTAETWRTWLHQVVAWQDQRLGWTIYSEELTVEYLAELEKIAREENREIDLLAERAKHEQEQAWKLQQYQQAAKQFGLSPSPQPDTLTYLDDLDPAQLWSGESMVGERLQELWSQLYSIKVVSSRLLEEEDVSPQVWRSLAVYTEQLPVLHVYQVAYPQPVEYIVPPAAVILSLANGLPSSEAFCIDASRIVKRLAVANSLASGQSNSAF